MIAHHAWSPDGPQPPQQLPPPPPTYAVGALRQTLRETPDELEGTPSANHDRHSRQPHLDPLAQERALDSRARRALRSGPVLAEAEQVADQDESRAPRALGGARLLPGLRHAQHEHNLSNGSINAELPQHRHVGPGWSRVDSRRPPHRQSGDPPSLPICQFNRTGFRPRTRAWPQPGSAPTIRTNPRTEPGTVQTPRPRRRAPPRIPTHRMDNRHPQVRGIRRRLTASDETGERDREAVHAYRRVGLH